jgi:hypothetical protein
MLHTFHLFTHIFSPILQTFPSLHPHCKPSISSPIL